MKCVGYMLCRCSVHGTVHAKDFVEREGPTGAERHYYECLGTPEDTGGPCDGEMESLGQRCPRPDWAEYPSDPR
jgi:hypothetical protein